MLTAGSSHWLLSTISRDYKSSVRRFFRNALARISKFLYGMPVVSDYKLYWILHILHVLL